MSLLCSLWSITDACGHPLGFAGAWKAEPGYEHGDAEAFATLRHLRHWSLRMQVTLLSCREGGCSSALPWSWDSCVHLCLPSFSIYHRELREQDKCSHSVFLLLSLAQGTLSLDFWFCCKSSSSVQGTSARALLRAQCQFHPLTVWRWARGCPGLVFPVGCGGDGLVVLQGQSVSVCWCLVRAG